MYYKLLGKYLKYFFVWKGVGKFVWYSGSITGTGFVAELSAKSKWRNADTLMRDIYSCDISCFMFRRERGEQAKTKYLMICVHIEKQRQKSATQWSLESVIFLIICSPTRPTKVPKGMPRMSV